MYSILLAAMLTAPGAPPVAIVSGNGCAGSRAAVGYVVAAGGCNGRTPQAAPVNGCNGGSAGFGGPVHSFHQHRANVRQSRRQARHTAATVGSYVPVQAVASVPVQAVAVTVAPPQATITCQARSKVIVPRQRFYFTAPSMGNCPNGNCPNQRQSF